MKALRRTTLVLALMVAATPAIEAQSSPPPPQKQAFNPAGTYDLQLSFGGQPTPITMELTKSNDSWSGSAGNPNLGTAIVTSLKQDGRTFTVQLNADGVAYSITVTVKEDSTVTGKWEGNGDGSAVSGKKTK